MSEHYFTNQPETDHRREKWQFELLGEPFSFITDRGVFSKQTVDFGSRVLLSAFRENELPIGAILDVGCGYGPIGLALAKKTNRTVDMVDVNERALELARENAELNKLSSVNIFASNSYETVSRSDYAAVVSNPPIRAGKKVVHEILSGAYEVLQEGGTLTIVIQKKQGAPSAEKKMQEVFGNVETVTREKGYHILKSIKTPQGDYK